MAERRNLAQTQQTTCGPPEKVRHVAPERTQKIPEVDQGPYFPK